MKQRFSSLDVKVIASELSSALVTLRISNIYDLSTRIFLIKFAKPGRREQLLIDSGFRCHLTSFSRAAAAAPSAFVSKLRKYLKSRRVTGVTQIGTDRVIEITFSDGQYRLFLEFFAAGNIILTDAELNVLALLRQVNEGDEDVDVRLGAKYSVDAKQNYHGVPDLQDTRVRAALEQAIQKAKAAKEEGGKKAKKAKGGDELKKGLAAGFPEYPPHLLEHVYEEFGVDGRWNMQDVLVNQTFMDQLMSALTQADSLLNSLGTGAAKGYIIAKVKPPTENETATEGSEPREALLYDDFHPFRPAHLANKPAIQVLEFDGFNKTVDEFYSSIESQKLESRLNEREENAKRKLQTAVDEHQKRLGALQHVQEMHIRKAQAIEANTHRVEEACAAVNGLIGQGMDWVDIGKLIENEQDRGNVVAEMVKLPLKLHENTVTLLLDEPGFEDDSDDNGDITDEDSGSENDDERGTKNASAVHNGKRLAIDIDLALTPWANARQYYEQKKSAAVKEQKTIQSSNKALKSTEKKIEADLKKGLKQEKTALRPARRQFWFEKFLYFVSSDGYLVLGGKDAQQNEFLYRRYLKKGDVYVHADLQGASSVIVKNNPQTPDAPIPPSTLSQAGALSVCTSTAWDSKAVMAAWWVTSDQVSKTAETGEYLTTGGFVIRGKKNFLPPSQLLLGLGVMWLISPESRVNHGKHRLIKTESMVEGEAQLLADDARGLSVEDNTDAEDDDTQPEINQDKKVIPNIENAAENAVGEIKEDHDAEEVAFEEDDNDEEGGESEPSEIGSFSGDSRANPLQRNRKASLSFSSKNDPVIAEDQGAISGHEADEDGGSDDDGEAEGQEKENVSTTHQIDDTSSPRTKKSQMNSHSQPNQPARGKRGKAKKAKKKYAEQDEEDRLLAMELLGSNKAIERKEAADHDRAAKEAKATADKERRRAQHTKAAEREKMRQDRLADTNDIDNTLDEIEGEQLAQERQEHMNIDLLVPLPEPGDELLAALPVVAPWSALGRCKYKMKLQPGNVKKGKAVKEIVGTWSALATKGPKVVDETNRDRERVWSREVELIKAWRVEEIVGVLPVKGVRVVHSGGGQSSGANAGGKGQKGSGGGSGARGGKGSKKSR